MEIPQLRLKAGRDASLLRRHPWIFSGSVELVQGNPQAGDTILVTSARGQALALASYSPQSSIRARVWTFDVDTPIDEAFFKARIKRAIFSRGKILEQDAVRLVHAESDGLPGVIADRYKQWIVVQVLTTGAEKHREQIIEAIVEETGCKNVYERSDADVRILEGLEQRCGLLRGDFTPESIEISEHGLRYLIDFTHGQKTGFFIDQRDNRAKLSSYSDEKQVLNCFCYTGGFTLNAMAGGARNIISIDSSSTAIALAKRNWSKNHFSDDAAEWIEGDVFQELRRFRDGAQSFDLIILDPPKFAATNAQSEKAARAYKDINLLAFKLLRPGGFLFTFSCSGGIGKELFQKIVADAALDAHVDAKILERLSQAADHPVALAFPEGEYLKGLICQVR